MRPLKQPTSPGPWVDTLAARREGLERQAQARVPRMSRPPPLQSAPGRVRSIPPPPAPTVVTRPSRAKASPAELVAREPSLRLALRDDDLFQAQDRTMVLTEARGSRSFPLWSALLLATSVIVVCMVVARPADARRVADMGPKALVALRLGWETARAAAQQKIQRTAIELGLSAPEAGPADTIVAPPSLPQEHEPSKTVDDVPLMSVPTELPSPAELEGEGEAVLAPDTDEVPTEAEPEVAPEVEVVALAKPVKAVAPVRKAKREVSRPRPLAVVAEVRPVAVPAVQPARTGILRINARPWAEVYVDGKFIGHTPQTNLELPAGRHRVTLKNAEFDLTKDISVRIKPGATSTKVVNLVGANKG